ncbi:NAD(P)/FAD-dependent oxidoreductase [Catenulispora subtropica]|uniref:Rhodanese domain-containing protein n=1 Tax=Catenulispora subtropica TaxID=450798 RepID=A0ABN2TBI2_9ACTN
MNRTVPLIIVIQPDLWKRHLLYREVDEWCEKSLAVLAFGTTEDLAFVLNGPEGHHVAGILYDEAEGGEVRRIVNEAPAGLRPPMAKVPGNEDSWRRTSKGDLSHIAKAQRDLEREVESIFFQWVPPESESPLRFSGTPTSRDAFKLRRFLLANGVPYIWETGDGSQISMHYGGGTVVDPSIGHIYQALGLSTDPLKIDKERLYDLAIIGAGPAGLAAAISAAAAGFSVVMVEKERPGGSAASSINLIRNYMGFPNGISGTRLMRFATDQISQLELVDWFPTITATHLERDALRPGRFVVFCADGGVMTPFYAGMILIACGQEAKSVIEGRALSAKEAYFVRSGDIQYNLERSDALRNLKTPIVIIGGGRTAGRAAILLRQAGVDCKLLARGFSEMGDLYSRIQNDGGAENFVRCAEILSFEGDDALASIRYVNKSGESCSLDAAQAFVAVGGRPCTGWLKNEGSDPSMPSIRLKDGFILTDRQLGSRWSRLPFETSERGIFAVGDVRVNSQRRVAQAAGQGVAAIASMDAYLGRGRWKKILQDERSLAWQDRQIPRL